jgi:hypothetical protein
MKSILRGKNLDFGVLSNEKYEVRDALNIVLLFKWL